MKVLQIERGQKGGYFTKCEGQEKNIYTKEQPNWNPGDELDQARFELSPSGKSMMLKKGEFTTPAKPAYQKPAYQPKDESWTTLNCAYLIAKDFTVPSLQVKPVSPSDAQIKAYKALARELYIDMVESKALVNVVKNG